MKAPNQLDSTHLSAVFDSFKGVLLCSLISFSFCSLSMDYFIGRLISWLVPLGLKPKHLPPIPTVSITTTATEMHS